MLLLGRARILFAGAAAVAIAAVGVSWLFGEVWPNLLVLQVQPWRALWIIAVFGAAGLALCGVKLWRGGSVSRIALAALAVGWLTPDSPAALVASALALGLCGLQRMGWRPVIGRPLVVTVWGLAVAFAVLQFGRTAMLGAEAVAAMPRSAYAWSFLVSLHLQAIVIAPLAVASASASPARWGKAATWIAPPMGAAFLLIGLTGWNRASADPPQDLARLIAGRPGPVEWIDGDTQTWTYAERANWASELQGASIVFSREQAMLWASRMRLLLRLGLADPAILHPFDKSESHITRPTAAALTALCQAPDGPAWIVSGVVDGEAPPVTPTTQLWRPPTPIYLYGGRMRWLRISTYAVTRCGPPV